MTHIHEKLRRPDEVTSVFSSLSYAHKHVCQSDRKFIDSISLYAIDMSRVKDVTHIPLPLCSLGYANRKCFEWKGDSRR